MTYKAFAMRSTLLFVPALMLFSFSSFAEVPLSQEDILGTWQIDKAKIKDIFMLTSYVTCYDFISD
jgi:hypothetical protein